MSNTQGSCCPPCAGSAMETLYVSKYVAKVCERGRDETQSLLRAVEASRSRAGPDAVMFLYALVFMAYHSSRWIPLHKRLKFQIVNAVFVVVVVAPQLYVMWRPKSSRYCRQPLLNNLAASVALSIVASGFSVSFTLMDPVPQGLWAAFHLFGLLSCGHGLCTVILTLTAAACAQTTPEVYHASVALTVASICSASFFMVRVGVWLSGRRSLTGTSRNDE